MSESGLLPILALALFFILPPHRSPGITLDLGFSALQIDAPPQLAEKYDKVQYTLVDCPGHASLIRTVIGGAQIIDLMILVIDINKGIQTQTAECLVIGEILTDQMIVVLNKTDTLKEPEKAIPKMMKKLSMTFKATKFGAGVPMLALAANPGGTKVAAQIQDSAKGDVSELVQLLTSSLKEPKRAEAGNFYFAVDHCFSIKGQGTIVTGTVLSGAVEVNQTVEIPDLKVQKKVKSMQMFKKPVQRAIQGDRLGICLTQLEAGVMERGILCAPGTVGSFGAVIISVEKIRFYKSDVKNKAKMHVTIGHSTSMATLHLCSVERPEQAAEPFSLDREYLHSELLQPTSKEYPAGSQYALLVFDSPVTCPLNCIVIGSRLDQDIHLNSCRLAFSGRLLQGLDYENKVERARFKVYKMKERVGGVERVHDDYTIIGKDLFSKNTGLGDPACAISRTLTGSGCFIPKRNLHSLFVVCSPT